MIPFFKKLNNLKVAYKFTSASLLSAPLFSPQLFLPLLHLVAHPMSPFVDRCPFCNESFCQPARQHESVPVSSLSLSLFALKSEAKRLKRSA